MYNCWYLESTKNCKQNHNEVYPEDVSVCEPKHVSRYTTNTSNKMRAVYDYIILYHIYWSRSSLCE